MWGLPAHRAAGGNVATGISGKFDRAAAFAAGKRNALLRQAMGANLFEKLP